MSKRVKSTKRAGRKVDKKILAPKPNEISKDLDAIFRSRWHGAVNIRGIRYQILYSLFRAFDLYNEENSTAALRLEGIEDVDFLGIRGFHYENEYVQVKSADKDWSWNQLKGPLAGFLSVHRNDANCGFVLAIGFSLTGDIEKLTQLDSLLASERKRVENKFCKLCTQVGYSEIESNTLLQKLTILSVP
ncbi:MAG: dsDNA nuclease domain-containing protein, partial [Thermosynechococcaceae cyanobacterium]